MDSRKRLLVCTEGKSCRRNGGEELYAAFKKSVKRYDLKDYFKVKEADCLGLCEQCPAVVIKPEKVAYGRVGIEHIQEILSRHMVSSEPIGEIVINRSKKK
ncbi:MAG: (2Fe-2S) ferredoxin domain-containing protein [Candidatus Obscuribacterales bacterium]|nr:(2Fe-2S) ferredoxin domain-containing protein [Candidatus Obscuribacterales bacterium]